MENSKTTRNLQWKHLRQNKQLPGLDEKEGPYKEESGNKITWPGGQWHWCRERK